MASELDTAFLEMVTGMLADFDCRSIPFYSVPTDHQVATGATTPGTLLGSVRGFVYEEDRDYSGGDVVRTSDLTIIIADPPDWNPEIGQIVTIVDPTQTTVQMQVTSAKPISGPQQVVAWMLGVSR